MKVKKRKRKSVIKEVIQGYLSRNIREYFLVTLIFLIGIILGVIFINKANETQIQEIGNYFTEFIGKMQQEVKVDRGELLKNSLISNFCLALLLWFAGSTVIGFPIIYVTTAYRGFCLGYTIAASISALGSGNGLLFSLAAVLLQNILVIPCILALSVSGIKLYKTIMKDKQRETIKLEITRHTLFCIMIFIILVLASFLEVYGSTTLLELGAKYIQLS